MLKKPRNGPTGVCLCKAMSAGRRRGSVQKSQAGNKDKQKETLDMALIRGAPASGGHKRLVGD